jgi:beta-galactosidase
LPVTVSSGTTADDRRAWFVFNWSWDATSITLDRDVTDAVTADAHASGTELPLGAWSTLTLLDG